MALLTSIFGFKNENIQKPKINSTSPHNIPESFERGAIECYTLKLSFAPILKPSIGISMAGEGDIKKGVILIRPPVFCLGDAVSTIGKYHIAYTGSKWVRSVQKYSEYSAR